MLTLTYCEIGAQGNVYDPEARTGFECILRRQFGYELFYSTSLVRAAKRYIEMGKEKPDELENYISAEQGKVRAMTQVCELFSTVYLINMAHYPQ